MGIVMMIWQKARDSPKEGRICGEMPSDDARKMGKSGQAYTLC
jgi:hypothetical protein